LPAAAVQAPLVLAGDHEPLMLRIQILLGRGLQQPPVVFVDGDGALDQLVELLNPAEVVQALRG
jgi:hypothetical protein